jgi:hypothetical protein
LEPSEEDHCIFSAIDAALDAVEVAPQVSAALLAQAFCY